MLKLPRLMAVCRSRVSHGRVTVKPVMRYVMWLSTLLFLVMACDLSIVYAQEQGRGDQPIPPGSQGGEILSQGRMGERGQMT